jgi:UDP-N-acetylmuramate dehydrogenase
MHFIKHNPNPQLPVMVLGEGSNILFKSDYNGILIHPVIRGMEIINKDRDSVFVKSGTGENWDTFVEWAVKQGFGGIENLSHIPGSVGASPIQNIGAYGVEVSEVIDSVETIDLMDGHLKSFTRSECDFGYRNSIFKNELKGKIIITGVIFRLSKSPVLKTNYSGISERLKKYKDININTLRIVVTEIRSEKLPDPARIGNAGSFFKNPVIADDEYRKLVSVFPEIPDHPADIPGYRKIPAAWLIEKCGWKGKRTGDAGTWSKQPLVMVNYGNATGKDILKMAEKITEDVLKKFGIKLEREVNVV